MGIANQQQATDQKTTFFAPLFRVTLFSKYFALTVFTILPFITGFVFYMYGYDTGYHNALNERSTWVLPKQVAVSVRENYPVQVCDKYAFIVGSKTESLFNHSEMLGVELPTLLGFRWDETSSDSTSTIFPRCVHPSLDTDAEIHGMGPVGPLTIRVPNYAIPKDCEIIEGEFGGIACATKADGTTPQILNNGSDGFAKLLIDQYKNDLKWKIIALSDFRSVVPITLFESDSEINALVSGNHRAFIIRFQKETYDPDFIRSYLSNIQKI